MLSIASLVQITQKCLPFFSVALNLYSFVPRYSEVESHLEWRDEP